MGMTIKTDGKDSFTATKKDFGYNDLHEKKYQSNYLTPIITLYKF